jgi:diguanylate cyclase (GGDEF)-like protein/putative nucleotidyltransferase with HDIG domain
MMANIKKASTVYLLFICLLGVSAYVWVYFFEIEHFINPTISLALIFAISLLNYFTIPIPPEDNHISMDSAIYLATLFLFGLDIGLYVLFFCSIILVAQRWRITWWKHLLNFSIYSLMMIISYSLFILLGGQIGAIDTSKLLPYFISLSVYFFINMLLTSLYFFFSDSDNYISFIRNVLKAKSFLVSYFSTLLFSIILGILLNFEGIFGLFLFICVAMLLSIAFSQNFRLFRAVSDKAQKDYLTGLHNHGHFKEALEKEVDTAKSLGRPLSLGLIDLDDFKKYNDLYGHIKGDHLLKSFGSLLETYTPKEYLVARYGGEEFAILMPNTTSKQALIFMNGLLKKTNESDFEGTEILPYCCLSFSAGIAQLEKGTYHSSELLNRADQATYFSKGQGKNMVQIYHESSEDLFYQSLSIEKELEKVEQQLKIFLAKDVYTYSHSKRVYQYAVLFSQKLGLSVHEREVFTVGALAHDIGKIEVPRDILGKKGRLEPHEWEIVKKHVIWGKDLLSTNKRLEEVIPLVELHHERYDGTGYPYGIKGDNIPKLARLLTIINAFDSMTTDRTYQKARSVQDAIAELRACSGTQFDPQYIEPFIELIEEKHDLKNEQTLVI